MITWKPPLSVFVIGTFIQLIPTILFANGYHIGMINKWLVYIHENVEPVLSLVPRSKGSGIAQVVETSNAESPTPVYVYRKHYWQQTTKSLEANEGCIQYTSWGVPVALFLTTLLELPDSYCVKTKAYSYALYVYMSAQPLPIGASGMGIDVTKITLLLWKPPCLAGKVWHSGLI